MSTNKSRQTVVGLIREEVADLLRSAGHSSPKIGSITKDGDGSFTVEVLHPPKSYWVKVRVEIRREAPVIGPPQWRPPI